MIRISAVALASSLVLLAAPQYNIDTFAGTDYTGDGRSALSAVLVQPRAVATDRLGNIYFSDAGDHRVRKIAPNGIIQTIAGTGAAGYRGDGGPAVKALLNAPYGLAVDQSGNLFVADLGNAVVRRISPDGTITTVAGGGDTPADGRAIFVATKAKLSQPRDVAVDRAGNLFVSDFAAHRIYQVTPNGNLAVIAGTGEPGTPADFAPAVIARLAFPAGIAVDDLRNIYVADSGNRRVRRISSGMIFTLTNKSGKQLEFGTPTGVALDSMGRIYVADGGAGVTMVTPYGDFMLLPIGGTSLAVNYLMEIFTTEGRQLKRLSGAQYDAIAGSTSGTAAGDGRASSEWRFNAPSGLARDAGGNLYIADTANGRVRRITPEGSLTTLTTKVTAPVSLAFDSQRRLHIADRATGNIYRLYSDGRLEVFASGAENRPFKPSSIVFDAGDRLYLADTGNDLIRRIDPDGIGTIVAGGGTDTRDAPALLARLAAPVGLAVTANGDLWFTEAGSGRVRKLTPSGRIETLAGALFREPRAIRLDAEGDLLVTDAADHRVYRVPLDGSWSPVAGSGDKGFGGDGAHALAAMLNTPSDLLLNPDGSLLIADTGNNRIRKLTAIPDVPDNPPVQIVLPSIAVKHAATWNEQPLAPGQLAVITSDEALPDGITVSLDGLRSPVLAADKNAATVQVPADLKPGFYECVVAKAEAVFAKAAVEIVASAPGLLTAPGRTGPAAAVNENGTVNSPESPAGRGTIVALYITGEGTKQPAVTAEIGGYVCDVVWAGPAPNLAGLFQVNVRTPSGFAPSGVQRVVLTVNGIQTQPGVTIVTR